MRCRRCGEMANYEVYWTDKFGIVTKKNNCETCDTHKTNNKQTSFI